ncbi:TonB-dependent receptor [Rhizobacter sp. LjRoot28]
MLLVGSTLAADAAFAQPVGPSSPDTPAAAVLPPIVVTATRTESDAFELPASIDRIDGADLRRSRAQVSLTESLSAIPGLQARERQNYAQDLQISIRGFGARSTFGIRGVRLYVDEIPATQPDGQGQITHVDLGTVGHVEVLRGPFSALYGNSSGGVIQVFTETPAGRPRLSVGAAAGSDGMLRVSTQATGTEGSLGYVVGASRFRTDGHREHSAADRRLGNAKLTWQPDPSSRWTVVANSVDLPRAQDPLGLKRAQFDAAPRSADPAAIAFDTRKTLHQTQGGIIHERRLSPEHSLRALLYTGRRGISQAQAIPVDPQENPLHPGGWIALDRRYGGADLRWTWRTRWLDGPLDVVGGLARDTLNEHRRGFRNSIDGTLGVQGPLRRDEHNRVTSTDQYLQLAWRPTEAWSLHAGVRQSRVQFKSQDAYVVGNNPDDSGGTQYRATLPVLGALYALDESVHLYVTAGRGFETPTLNELAYRPNGATGMNLALQSARSHSVEAGIKARLGAWGDLNLAAFRTRSDREIVTLSNTGGRATFQNAGATERRGLELAWTASAWQHLRADLAATAMDAIYRDAFSSCAGTPCPTPNLNIPAGNRIPGVARGAAFAAVAWAPPTGWRGGLEARYLTGVPVNDANTDAAPAYTTVAAHGGYVMQMGAWELGGFARVDNLLDRHHAGSVIVNEGNGRHFEPGAGRTWLVGLSASVGF